MAQLTITIPDALLPRVLDGFAAANNYTGKAPDGTAETKAAFAKRRISDFIKASVAQAEASAAAAAASTQAGTDIALS